MSIGGFVNDEGQFSSSIDKKHLNDLNITARERARPCSYNHNIAPQLGLLKVERSKDIAPKQL